MFREQGFTLLEMSIALVVIGVLAVAGWSLLKPSFDVTEKLKIEQQLQIVEQTIVTFALNNYRLPCPDTNGDGYEENCSTSTAKTGGLPFSTLGLSENALLRRIIYGAHKGTGSQNITVVQERTGDSPGDVGYKSLGDLLKALDEISVAAVTNTQIYITGDGQRTGAENCATNQVANTSFILAAGGARSMNGDTNVFDGVNSGLQLNGSGSLCFASPSRLTDAGYDDLVKSMSINALKGQLLSLGYALKN